MVRVTEEFGEIPKVIGRVGGAAWTTKLLKTKNLQQPTVPQLSFGSLNTGDQDHVRPGPASPAGCFIFAQFDFHQEFHQFVVGRDADGLSIHASVVRDKHHFKMWAQFFRA